MKIPNFYMTIRSFPEREHFPQFNATKIPNRSLKNEETRYSPSNEFSVVENKVSLRQAFQSGQQ
jgi:hypothetical protein